MDTQDNIQAAAAGDHRAFAAIVEQYRQMVWRVALRMLGDPDEAEGDIHPGLEGHPGLRPALQPRHLARDHCRPPVLRHPAEALRSQEVRGGCRLGQCSGAGG